MMRMTFPSACALLVAFAGCSSMQPAIITTNIELVLDQTPS